jgi:hypothetical protein
VAALRVASWLPGAAGRDVAPEAAGGDVATEAAGGDVAPDAVGRDAAPDAAGRDAAPDAVGRDIAPDAAGRDIAPDAACALDVPSPRLAELLADLVPGLLAAELSEPAHTAALATLGVSRLDLAGIVAAVSGVDRPPAWWHELYAALAPLADSGTAGRDELAALPVPLADGRTVTGPRTTIMLDVPAPPIPELRVVHPDAAHPLLARLGAQPAGPRELLESPELREAVRRSVDEAEAGLDPLPLAEAALTLVREAQAAPPWLGDLALPAASGEIRRADELVLPGGALRGVLAPGGPLGVLRGDVAGRYARTVLVAAGVLDGFAVIDEEHPAGPDHELADEEHWWATLTEPPARLLAVRDLDLVDDDAWPHALRLIAADPATSRALHAQPSYTAWWLARHARLAGHQPGHWRLPSASDLAGLYDLVPALPVPLDDELLAAAGVRSALHVADAGDAVDLLARLADPGRDVSPAAATAAHAALVAAAVQQRFELDDVEPPLHVRAVTGVVSPAAGALVLDRPWLAGIAEPDRLVSGGDPRALAELLDLPVASDSLSAEVVSSGRTVRWARLPEVAAACDALGLAMPPGSLVRHDVLRVRTPDGALRTVAYWVDDAGTVHAADPLRALIWAPASRAAD